MQIAVTIPDRDDGRVVDIVRRAAGQVPDGISDHDTIAGFLADHLAATIRNIEASDLDAARPPAPEPEPLAITPEPLTTRIARADKSKPRR